MLKILLSLLTIVLVASAAVGATRAYFTDTETSSGNTFSAGTLDLKVNGQDDENVVHVSLSNLKPGDGEGTTEHPTISYQWTLSNTGSIVGKPWIEIRNVTNGENDCVEAEEGEDPSCEVDAGELGANLYMQINAAGGGGFEYPHGAGCIDGGRACPINYWASLPSIGKYSWETINPGSSIAPMVLELKVPSAIGNIIQSDSVEFDIVFHLDQV